MIDLVAAETAERQLSELQSAAAQAPTLRAQRDQAADQDRRQQELTQAQTSARGAVIKASAEIPTLRQEFMAWTQIGSDWLKEVDSVERELLGTLDSLLRAVRNSLGQAADEGAGIELEMRADSRARELFAGIGAHDSALALLPETAGANEFARDLVAFMAKHIREAYVPKVGVAQFKKNRLVRMLENKQKR